MKAIAGSAPEGVVLTVNGLRYQGWQSAQVTRSIESISGSFSLSVSERFTNQSKPWPINPGDACSVSIDDQNLITGYVDRRDGSFASGSHDVSVSGRDATGLLVDSSAGLLPKAATAKSGKHSKWEFKNVSVLDFVKQVCEPFGIKVSLQPYLPEPKPPAKFAISPGDTAFNAIEHACRLAGLLPISDGQGHLTLTQAGTERCTTNLIEGDNVLSASVSYDDSGRFYRYITLGQSAGTDENAGSAVSAVTGEAFDQGVKQTSRVLIVRPEGGVTRAQAQQRSEWEAIVRYARAATATVRVQGWRQGDGSLWPVNALVSAKIPSLEVGTDRDPVQLLITQATYSISPSAGTITELTLRRQNSFLPEPVIPPNKPDHRWQELENHGRGLR